MSGGGGQGKTRVCYFGMEGWVRGCDWSKMHLSTEWERGGVDDDDEDGLLMRGMEMAMG